MPATRKNIGDKARVVTRKALESGKLDRAAVRKITGEVRKTLRNVASQSASATLISGAMAARIASGMLAGIADSLARKPRRGR